MSIDTPAGPGAGKTALLVDDNAAVRVLTAVLLRRLGFDVLEAAGGAEAEAAARARPGGLDLLVTDVVMPGRRGREVAARVGRLHPRVRVLFVSGFADDADLQAAADRGAVHFLAKPFTPAAFADKVRAVLAS